ncbi:MAG: phage tail domain-containing protein [Candidatus Methanomethylophilaceae archaeon]|jgi:hypothetical protein
MVDNGGFKINDIAVSTYSITLLYGPSQPMLPGSIDRTADIPNRAGRLWIDSKLGPRTFSLPCQFATTSTDAAELDTLTRTFARVLVDAYGRPKKFKLEFDDCPGWYYTAKYNGGIPFDRKWVGCSDFKLELIADDPFAYAADESSVMSTITTSGDSISIVSAGTVSTPAKICVKNTGSATITGGFTITIQNEVY